MELSMTKNFMVKQEFGRRLYELMTERGWHQSELARQSGLPRDSISVYIRGKSLPNRENIEILAQCLGVKIEELINMRPKNGEENMKNDREIEISIGQKTAWINLKRRVSIKTALKIVELLEADDNLDEGSPV
jgi:transcriptional regulator with XRE-family HTH domain